MAGHKDSMLVMPTELTLPEHFFAWPVWRLEEDDRLYHPVMGQEDFKEHDFEVQIRAVFTTPGGRVLDGYVVGTRNIYAIGLFAGAEIHVLNLNLRDSSSLAQHVIDANPELGIRQIAELFPLTFETQMNDQIASNFSGSFDLSSRTPLY